MGVLTWMDRSDACVPYSEVGKRTIALRLKRYLRFFHGAKCKAFDISKLSGGHDIMSSHAGDAHSIHPHHSL